MIKITEKKSNSYITKSKLPDADYVINPYVGCPHKCIYCYAEFMKRFNRHEEDWGDFLVIKKANLKIDPNKYSGQTILFGSVTDAYNLYENKYKLTRSLLKNFVGSDVKVEILTKSGLVLRDMDLLKQIKHLKVGVSINTLDDIFRKEIEPFAASISKRISTLKSLRDNGISNYLFLSPIFPEITKFKDIIQATEGFVDQYCFENLNLRGAYLPRVLNLIERKHNKLFEIYNTIFKKKNYSYWDELETEINEFCQNKPLNYKIYFYHSKIKKR
jgi:DNA repair photolyase